MFCFLLLISLVLLLSSLYFEEQGRAFEEIWFEPHNSRDMVSGATSRKVTTSGTEIQLKLFFFKKKIISLSLLSFLCVFFFCFLLSKDQFSLLLYLSEACLARATYILWENQTLRQINLVTHFFEFLLYTLNPTTALFLKDNKFVM